MRGSREGEDKDDDDDGGERNNNILMLIFLSSLNLVTMELSDKGKVKPRTQVADGASGRASLKHHP